MTRNNSIWGRLNESTEGPNVTVSIPREWAEELMRSLMTALEIEDDEADEDGDEDDDVDVTAQPTGKRGPGRPPGSKNKSHPEPDDDDMPGAGPGDDDGDDDELAGMLDRAAGDDEDAEDDESGDEDEDDDEDELEDSLDNSHGRQDGFRPETALGESAFSKLAKSLGREKGVKNPNGLAAAIGRKKYGQAGMSAKSAAGRK